MWALVTGGAKRLGAALCMAMAEQGYSVAVHYRQSCAEAKEVVASCQAKGVEAVAIQGDFSSPESVKKFTLSYLEQFPQTSLLVNNVGNYLIGSALQTSIDDWLNLFQVNLHTPFMLSRLMSETLIRNRGQIINIGASGLRRKSAHCYSAAYTLTKDGLWGLTLSLARELAPHNVRVNMVSPGLLDHSVDNYPVPMHRPAHDSEVCRVATFLIDPASAYITGQNIEVAGGLGLA